jgi:hypothetical protein
MAISTLPYILYANYRLDKDEFYSILRNRQINWSLKQIYCSGLSTMFIMIVQFVIVLWRGFIHAVNPGDDM